MILLRHNFIIMMIFWNLVFIIIVGHLGIIAINGGEASYTKFQ